MRGEIKLGNIRINVWREILGVALVVLLLVALYMVAGSAGALQGYKKQLLVSATVLVLGRHFFCRKWLYSGSMLLLAVGAAAVIMVRSLSGAIVAWGGMCATVMWLLMLGALLMIVANAFGRTYRLVCSAVLLGGYGLLCALFVSYYLAEGTYLGTEAVLALMQTNAGESLEYVAGHMGLALVLLLLIGLFALAGLAIAMACYGGLVQLRRGAKVALAVYVASCVLLVGLNYKTRVIGDVVIYVSNYVTLPFIMAGQKQAEYDAFLALKAERAAALSNIELAASGDPGVYVLVIGESQSATHMGAYGYGRDTTPWLSSMVASGEALLFKNAFSCHTHTVQVLSYALTEKNQYNDRELKDSLSIVDMAKAAGFKTIWLSNQVHYGTFDTPTSVIADAADEQVFLNQNIGGTVDTDVLDGALVDELARVNVTDRTLIIVHLMGCHSGYVMRYPSDSVAFSSKSQVDYYDNAMRYNDYVVGELYREAQRLPGFKGLIYFADHGDDADNGLSHNSANFTPAMAKIPLYMLLAPSFKEEHSDRYQALTVATNEIFTNDLIYNTMLSIMGIRPAANYEPANDPLVPTYDGDINRFKTLYGKINIADIIGK